MPAKLPKTEPAPMFAVTETNIADDVIEVEDDSMAPGSSKESGNKNKEKLQAQKKLRTELWEIDEELPSYACIRERTGLSDECKKRTEALTSKRNEVEKRIKSRIQDVQPQQQLREKKKMALEKLTQDHPDISNP